MEKADVRVLPLAAYGFAAGVNRYYLKPQLTARRGWLAIAALITAYELAAPEGELLSEGADRALKTHKAAVIGSVCLTAAHLLNILPEQLDPFHQSLKVLKGRR